MGESAHCSLSAASSCRSVCIGLFHCFELQAVVRASGVLPHGDFYFSHIWKLARSFLRSSSQKKSAPLLSPDFPGDGFKIISC